MPSNEQNRTTSMNEQFARLDAVVQAGFRRLDEKMDRLQNDLHDNQINTNDRINALDKEIHETFLRKRARMDQIEKNLRDFETRHQDEYNELQTWQKVAMAKVGVISTTIALVWVLLAPTIRTFLGIANV